MLAPPPQGTRRLQLKSKSLPPSPPMHTPHDCVATCVTQCYCCSLQEGDLALFMAHRPRDSGHSKENYLAFTFDGRLYYLDSECAKLFKQDLTYQSSALGKRWAG